MGQRGYIAAIIILAIAAGSAFASGAREARSFEYPGIDSVYVKAEFLDVQVRGSIGFAVSMSSDISSGSLFGSRGYKVMHELSGSMLRVWIDKDNPFFSGFGAFGGFGGGTLYLEVPRGTRVKVETISGAVSVEGLAGGDVEVSSVSGRVEAQDVNGALVLSTVSGRISVDSAKGRLTAKSVSGAIEAQGVNIREDSGFSTVSGRIDVRFDTPLDDLRFDLSTVSGRIVVGTIRAEKGLRMGDGRVLVRGHTVSGSQSYR
jgi:hypothetical protein